MSRSIAPCPAAAAWQSDRLAFADPVAALDCQGIRPSPQVLVLANGSDAASNAAWRAELIAQSWGVPVRRIHTHRDPSARARTRHDDRYARDGGVLLVTHAEHGARPSDWLLGTHVEQLVRKLAIPVLIVRQPANRRYRRVVVGVKLEPAAGELIAAASCVAPGARITAVHVVGTSDESRLRRADVSEAALRACRTRVYRDANRRLDDLVAAADGPAAMALATRISAGSAPSRLLEISRAARGELIVLGRQPRHWLADFFLDSGVASRALAESDSDVLLVPLVRPWGTSRGELGVGPSLH